MRATEAASVGVFGPVPARAGRELMPVAGPEDAVLTLPDGVSLAADIYRPQVPGRFPVLLMRQPYGRRIASTIVLAHPAWYAAHGYIVVVQDVRGRGGSGGRFAALQAEAEDGAATLAWAAELPGCDGRVATYGFSYQATTQLLGLAGAVAAGTKRPDAIVPVMGAWDVRDDWVYEGDAFRLGLNQLWAAQMGAEQARLAGDAEAHAALAAAASGGMAGGLRPSRPDILSRFARYTHYDDWLGDDPALWDRVSPRRRLEGRIPAIPGLFVGGWLDIMVEGTLGMARAFEQVRPQSLVMGPWPHIPWGRRAAGADMGPAAALDIDRLTIEFLDAVMGRRDPVATEPRIRLFDVGARHWRGFAQWPQTESLVLHLASGGLAATTATDGGLALDPGPDGTDRLVHDPWRPAPAIGGALGAPAGYVDRGAIDERTDVAAYTSPPLERPLTLFGAPELLVRIDCDRASHGLAAILSVVHPDGRAIHLTDGYRRRSLASDPDPVRLALKSTFATVPAGAALRLSLQAAAFPAFAVEPGEGLAPADATRADLLVTTLAIRHGAATPSTLRLPILPEGPSS